MSGQSHEQHRNMGDRAVIPGSGQADDSRILHGDGQQPRKTSFHRASFIINRLEVPGSIIDGVPDAGRKPKEIVAPFLDHEVGMPCWAEEILPSIGFIPVQRACVLKIDPAFRVHPTLSMHGEVGGTEDGVLPEPEGIVPFSTGIEGDDGLGFHLQGDVREDVLAVKIGVAGDGRNREGEGRDFSKHGNGDFFLVPIVGVGDFIKREFGFRVDDAMVSVTPVEHDLRLEGLGKMDFDAEPGVGIAAGEFGFVEAILDRGFEVVLPDTGLDGTGIQSHNAAGDDVFLDERPDESFPKILQVRVGSRSKEAGEALQRGRMLEGRKSASRRDSGVVFQLEGQIGQGRKTAKMLIDQSAHKGVSGKGRTSSGAFFLTQRGQVGKQFFETDSGRDFFGREEALHDALEFREGWRKTLFSRVSKTQGLGYVADSYEKRSMRRKIGGSRKSVCLTRSKMSPKAGENHALLATGTLAYN